MSFYRCTICLSQILRNFSFNSIQFIYFVSHRTQRQCKVLPTFSLYVPTIVIQILTSVVHAIYMGGDEPGDSYVSHTSTHSHAGTPTHTHSRTHTQSHTHTVSHTHTHSCMQTPPSLPPPRGFHGACTVGHSKFLCCCPDECANRMCVCASGWRGRLGGERESFYTAMNRAGKGKIVGQKSAASISGALAPCSTDWPALEKASPTFIFVTPIKNTFSLFSQFFLITLFKQTTWLIPGFLGVFHFQNAKVQCPPIHTS